MGWKFTGYYARFGVDISEVAGVPVIVATASFVDAQNADGRSTRQTPHVRITVLGGSVNGVEYFDNLWVAAVGTPEHGRGRELLVYQSRRAPASTPDALIAEGREHLTEALAALAGLDAAYAAAEARTAQARRFAPFQTRESYEAACAELGVGARSDTNCKSLAISGDFRFPHYPADVVLAVELAARRGQAALAVDRQRIEEERRARESMSVTGNTYPVREQLAALGGIWDEDNGAWIMPTPEALVAGRALVAAASRPVPRATRRSGTSAYRPNGLGGICAACGDDCGGGLYSCGYGETPDVG